MSSACAVLCEGVTKVFPRREPSPGGSSSDMWLHYLRGWLRPGSSDPLAPSRTRLVAVDGVDLRIEPGEFFGLLGPNGAGKTTLVKMLATILVPSAGTAWVNGFDVTTQTRRVRSSVAVVSTRGWLGFDMQLPIQWNLKYWAALYGVPSALLDRRVREVLEIVDLAGKGRESSAVLSSGMRQRLAVAKGLLADAPVFLLDEPTIALDPKSANDIRLFIREEINDRKGTTVILTTQNMREAEEVCDRIAVLDRGRLVATGTVAGLRQR
ncbi:MAG TPA: ABC transporter ATP-binding protein, partial [Thermoanaerobaculia bacterium]|nr:ABC transporter ATP-binding protein [Thermoanaerobaculia bacterium]